MFEGLQHHKCLQCFDTVGWSAGRASGLQKLEWWGAGMVICLERGADLHMAQLMPLPLTVSCFSKIQIGFTFLVPAHPGSTRKRAVKRVCVCVCVFSASYLIRIICVSGTSTHTHTCLTSLFPGLHEVDLTVAVKHLHC